MQIACRTEENRETDLPSKLQADRRHPREKQHIDQSAPPRLLSPQQIAQSHQQQRKQHGKQQPVQNLIIIYRISGYAIAHRKRHAQPSRAREEAPQGKTGRKCRRGHIQQHQNIECQIQTLPPKEQKDVIEGIQK